MLNPFSGERSHTATDALRAEPPTRLDNLRVFPSATLSPKERTPSLSPRELQVLDLADYTNKEIAYVLECSQWTIKTHFRHIHKALGVSNRRAAVKAWAQVQGAVAEMPHQIEMEKAA